MKSDINLWAAVDGTSENVYALVKAASAEEAAAIAEEAQKRGSGSHGTDMYLPVTRDAVKSLGQASMLDSDSDWSDKQHTLKIVKKFMKSSAQVVDFNEVGIMTFPDLDTYAYGSVDESSIHETVFSNQRFKKLAGLLTESTQKTLKEAKTSSELGLEIMDKMWAFGTKLANKTLVGKRVKGYKLAAPTSATNWKVNRSDIEGVITDAEVAQDYEDVNILISVKTDSGEEVVTELGRVELVE